MSASATQGGHNNIARPAAIIAAAKCYWKTTEYYCRGGTTENTGLENAGEWFTLYKQ